MIATEQRQAPRSAEPGTERPFRRAVRRPRILYLASNDPRVALTGAAQRVNAFLNFLTPRFPVHFLYLEGAGRAPIRQSPPAKTMFPRLVTERVFRFSGPRYFLFSQDVYDAADEILRTKQADVIVCDYGVWGLYGSLLARKHGVPFIYSSHNVEWRGCLDKTRNDLRRLPLAAYYYGVERTAVKRADVLVAITDADAAWYTGWRGDRKTLVIPQGVDDRDFFPQPHRERSGPPRILFCGNFSIPFNREAISAVARHVVPVLLRERPDVIFECVGANPPARSPHPSMVFTGYADNYPERLRTCDAVMVPILRGHGFPTKIVEALACGRPTVATPVGARGLTFRVPHLSVTGIENFGPALLQALGRSEDDNQAAAHEVMERYGWNTILAPLEQSIYELTGRRAPTLAVV